MNETPNLQHPKLSGHPLPYCSRYYKTTKKTQPTCTSTHKDCNLPKKSATDFAAAKSGLPSNPMQKEWILLPKLLVPVWLGLQTDASSFNKRQATEATCGQQIGSRRGETVALCEVVELSCKEK